MRFTLFILAVVMLTLSGLAAHIFFGEKGADPERVEMLAHLRKIEAGVEAANSGHPNDQFRLAHLYRYGPEKTRNYRNALRLYRKAAEQGHVRAQYELGSMYAAGAGTKLSFHRAAEWFLLSANLGRNRDAQFALGDLYFKGRGVVHNYGTAISWYRKAARQRHPVAQFLLGVMYMEGWGVDKDLVEAYKWVLLAEPQAQRVTGHDSKLNPKLVRQRLEEEMNRSQEAAGRKAAKNWRPGQ